MYLIYSLLLILISIFNSHEQCLGNDEILKSETECISIEGLLFNSETELFFSNINYLSRTIKAISKNGYDVEFMRLDNKYIQMKHSLKSKIYISKNCIDSLEKKLNINDEVGMVMIYTNSNNKNQNGLPEKNFIIRYPGSGINKYIDASLYDFSFCHEDPILLNNSININDIKVFKKKEKTNAKDPDTYELTKVNIERVLYAKKRKVDLFDLHSEFFEDICFKFKREKNTDVTLETRTNDYYQNITLCDTKLNAYYIGFNYSKTDEILYYTCAYGFYESESEKNSYVDKINDKMNVVFTNSNFKVITCYKEIFQFKNILSNYGELMCVFVFFMQLIFFLTYCCRGTAPIQKQVDQLLASANKVDIIPPDMQDNKTPNTQRTDLVKNENANAECNKDINDNNKIDIDNNNIQITNNNNINSNDQNNNNSKGLKINKNIKRNNSIISSSEISSNIDAESKNEFMIHNNKDNNNDNKANNMLSKGKKKKKRRKSVRNLQNPPKQKSKRNSAIVDIKTKSLIIKDIDKNEIIPEEETNKVKKKKRRKSVNIVGKVKSLNDNEQDKTDLPNEKELKKKQEEEKEAKAEQEDQIKRQKIIKKRKSSQIFAFDNDDLNELNFDEARIFDKRHFCKYYCFMIQLSNIIVNTFCRCSDYNLFIIKFGLLLFLFPINLTFNAFFFTSSQIQSVYINKLSDISIDWKNLVRSFASSIISSIILIFLKLLCLTHSSIRKLKKETNVEEAKKKSISTIRCIKIRICVYFIFSLIFLLIFGYYVSCFCAIFENTQIVLMESMATSWALSLLYPFVICFVTSIFRRGALVCGKRGVGCCYKINKILQLI